MKMRISVIPQKPDHHLTSSHLTRFFAAEYHRRARFWRAGCIAVY
jgi:hypothetical protein